MDLELRSLDRIADASLILSDSLAELESFGQYISAFEYKMTFYGEGVSIEELREWVNWVNSIRNKVSDALGVLGERSGERRE